MKIIFGSKSNRPDFLLGLKANCAYFFGSVCDPRNESLNLVLFLLLVHREQLVTSTYVFKSALSATRARVDLFLNYYIFM